jgi:hypothetical protein
MNLDDILPSGGIEALASQLGIPGDQARQGAEALLPSVLGHMGQNAEQLDTHVSELGGTALADNVTGPDPTDVSRGNELLGSIFGSKDVSRDVAGQAAQQTGLDSSLLKKMLPILAMLVAGHLAGRSQGQQSGGLGGILGSVLSQLGGTSGQNTAQGGLGGILDSILGGNR